MLHRIRANNPAISSPLIGGSMLYAILIVCCRKQFAGLMPSVKPAMLHAITKRILTDQFAGTQEIAQSDIFAFQKVVGSPAHPLFNRFCRDRGDIGRFRSEKSLLCVHWFIIRQFSPVVRREKGGKSSINQFAARK